MSSPDPNNSPPISLSAHIEEIPDADDVGSQSASAERSRNCSSPSSTATSELRQYPANPDHEPMPPAVTVAPGLGDSDTVEQTGQHTPTFLDSRSGADHVAEVDSLYESPRPSSSPPAAGNTITFTNHAQERLSPPPSLPSPAAIPSGVDDSHPSRDHASNAIATPILYEATPTPLPAAGHGDMGSSHPLGGPDVHKSGPSASNPQPTLIAGQTAWPNQLTGWPAVEKALTEFDRQEIGAYKEDIDSLLTFTGLYSAVLTAFVIVSYPQLQEDTAGETLQVLRLIAVQTATYSVIGGQLVNSTAAAPSASPPFQPSAAAIRINALWFASLVISLAVASISIFVKQWLRAYMSFASASPQGQLRIRHFRRSGIEAWRVFEIASMLPLLLQISLALFFVGLCIFTFDVHPVIGKTTLPLVCAWAFLLLVTIMSPIFSSRCPYKTPALSAVTTFLRTRILPGATIIILKHIPYSVIYALSIISSRFTATAEQLDKWVPLDVWVEEESVLSDKQWDLAILAAADVLQADDTLLETTMTEALKQSNSDWVLVTEFLIRAIGNRVPLAGSEDPRKFPATAIQQYHLLSDAARIAIHNLFRDHVLPGLFRSNPDWSVEHTPAHSMGNWSRSIFEEIYDPGSALIVDAFKGVQWDLAMLNSADVLAKLLLNDNVLATAVAEFLRYDGQKLEWVDATEFIIRMIGSRVSLTGSDDPRRFPATAIHQYHLLSDAARAAICNLCTDHVVPGLVKSAPGWLEDSALHCMADWSRCIFAVVYDNGHPFPAESVQWNLVALNSFDALLADDNVLATAMTNMLKQNNQRLDWVDVTKFLVHAIDNRVPLRLWLAGGDNFREHRRTAVDWCGSLSEAARTAIGDLFRAHVIPGLAKSTVQSENTAGLEVTITQSWRIFAGIYDLGVQCMLLRDILKLDNGQLNLETLGLVDALLVDDNFFATTMTKLLKERSLDPVSVTEFLVRAISNHIHFDNPQKRHTPFKFIPWEPKQCYLLSHAARSAITELPCFDVMVLEKPWNTFRVLDRPMVEWLRDIFVGLCCGSSAFGAQTISMPRAFFDRWRQELDQGSKLLSQSGYPPVVYSESGLILSMCLLRVLIWTETEPNQEYYQWEVVSETLRTIGSHEGSLRYINLGMPVLLEKVSLAILHRLQLVEISHSTTLLYLAGVVLALKLHMSAATSGLDIQDKDDWDVAFKDAMKNIMGSQRGWEILHEKLPLEHGGSGQEHWSIQQALELLVQRITYNLMHASRVLYYRAELTIGLSRVHVLKLSWLAITLVEDRGFDKATDAGSSSSESSSDYSELRSVLKLAARALFKTSVLQDLRRESEILTRICKSLPPCTNDENYSRIACLSGLVIPDYFYLSLWSAAVSLRIPINHSRFLCIENMTEEERDAIRTQGEEDFKELRREREW